MAFKDERMDEKLKGRITEAIAILNNMNPLSAEAQEMIWDMCVLSYGDGRVDATGDVLAYIRKEITIEELQKRMKIE